MSRGLGQHQRLVLAVLLRMERETGARQWWSVADVLNAMWNVEMRPKREAREAQAVECEAEWRADVEGRAAAGDAGAMEQLKAAAMLRRLDVAIAGKRAPQRVRDDPGFLERDMNPSRVIRQLRARGLVERASRRGSGPGWVVKLTDVGAVISVGSSLPQREAGVEFIPENGVGAGVGLRKVREIDADRD